MSWSTNGSSLTPDQIRYLPEPVFTPEHEDESREQFNAALEAAASIAQSGVVGDPDRHVFNVTVSGHANVDHDNAPGWTNDFVTVSVNQCWSR